MNKQLLITGHVFELEKDCMCKYQGCEKMLKCMRWFLLSITVLGLSGCATNCNIFSGSNSLACDAKLLATVAVGLVTVMPVVLVSDAIDNAKDERDKRDEARKAAEREKTIRAGLAQNDPEIIKECLLECEFIPGFKEAVNIELYQDAAKRFLAGAVSNTAEQQGYTVMAHHALSWYYPQEADSQTINHEHFNHVYRLLQQPETYEQLQAIQQTDSYNYLITRIEAMKFAIESTDDADTAQTIFEQCPQAVSPLLNNVIDPDRGFDTCKYAYKYRFNETAPYLLGIEWKAQIRERYNVDFSENTRWINLKITAPPYTVVSYIEAPYSVVDEQCPDEIRQRQMRHSFKFEFLKDSEAGRVYTKKVPLDGGGLCKWRLSTLDFGLAYTSVEHLELGDDYQIGPGSRVKLYFYNENGLAYHRERFISYTPEFYIVYEDIEKTVPGEGYQLGSSASGKWIDFMTPIKWDNVFYLNTDLIIDEYDIDFSPKLIENKRAFFQDLGKFGVDRAISTIYYIDGKEINRDSRRPRYSILNNPDFYIFRGKHDDY